MSAVTVSSRFQVVIPKDVREALDLERGQKLEAFAWEGHIVLVPAPTVEEMRGRMTGIVNDFERGPDRL